MLETIMIRKDRRNSEHEILGLKVDEQKAQGKY